MIRHKLTNSANRKGVELGFRVNTWRLNFARAKAVSELVILCQCARTAAQTVADISKTQCICTKTFTI